MNNGYKKNRGTIKDAFGLIVEQSLFIIKKEIKNFINQIPHHHNFFPLRKGLF